MNNTNKNLVDAKEHINNAASELSSTCISLDLIGGGSFNSTIEQINIVILDLESSVRKLDDHIQQAVIRDTLSKMVNQITIKNKIRHLIAFPILFFIDIGLWLCNMGDWSTLRHQSRITKTETTISNNNIVDIERIRSIANECNCRAEHGAEGKEHLLQIEKMLKQALSINEIKPQ